MSDQREAEWRLEDIGFYTLSDDRADHTSSDAPLARCELIVTGRCNFRCPYCRSVGGPDLSLEAAERTLDLWITDGLRNVRFSGGEPTLWPGLEHVVALCKDGGVERIALSTNGSASLSKYEGLLRAGANDFSISLDACCAEDVEQMTGGNRGAFDQIVESVRWLSARAYVTVGVVLTAENASRVGDTIQFAAGLGVSDIRVIPAAQAGTLLPPVKLPPPFDRSRFPILDYRLKNLAEGKGVRGNPTRRCGLVLDDMAVMGGEHYPCIIYMREGGAPIGQVGPQMRAERLEWACNHDCMRDPICAANCLDVCVDYNNRVQNTNSTALVACGKEAVRG